MTINFGNWMHRAGEWVPGQVSLRAQIQWARILDKQFDIEFIRGGVKMAPQTVRVELHDSITNEVGVSGDSTMRKAIVFGIHGHPELDSPTTFNLTETIYSCGLCYLYILRL